MVATLTTMVKALQCNITRKRPANSQSPKSFVEPAEQADHDLKIAVTAAPESAVAMSCITDWRSLRRLAADHPWEDPGYGHFERQSRGIGHSVLVVKVQTELHQGPEAGHL